MIREDTKMNIRFGYVAIALNLNKVTSSGSVTYTNYNKLSSEEKRIDKLKSVTFSNLNNLYRILEYTNNNEIHFYRITSALIPLATHPEVMWDYRTFFSKDFEKIGDFINKNNLRVDTHPDQFNVINSEKEDVVESTINNLLFHVNLFEDLNYTQGKMVLHVGSSAGGKEKALNRFKENFIKMPAEISSRIVLENDDKTFTAMETLELCREMSIPMVLDVHHHLCNNKGEKLEDKIDNIFSTWDRETLPPKIHFSSPRESKYDKKHADFVEATSLINFIEMTKSTNRDYDIMLEAKMKDLALFKLINDIYKIKPEWKWSDKSTLTL
jgi:UV DNA damage endonuclease